MFYLIIGRKDTRLLRDLGKQKGGLEDVIRSASDGLAILMSDSALSATLYKKAKCIRVWSNIRFDFCETIDNPNSAESIGYSILMYF